MWKINRIEARAEAKLYVEFEDGVSGEIDLTDRLRGPMAEPLRKQAFFRQAFIDEYGAIAWPNGYDLAPDALHERLLRAHRRARPKPA